VKTIAFKVNKSASPDEWVREGAEQLAPATPPAPTKAAAEPMKRLTIDVTADQHQRISVGCAQRKIKIADLIRDFIDRDFPKS
jgi:hypothetical protein